MLVELLKVDLLEQMDEKSEYKACINARVLNEGIVNTFCCSLQLVVYNFKMQKSHVYVRIPTCRGM